MENLPKSATLEKLTATYSQDPDSNSMDLQFLEISTEDAGAGNYYVIKTDRWAFDNTDELISVINDFIKKIS